MGPGDSVTIGIYGQPDASNVYVGDDGSISVPLAGKVAVSGLSPIEASARVAKALKDGGYFVDPQVTIVVVQSRSQLVSVLGEVQTSGRYPINPRTTVVDLLAQAGGVKDTASDTVIVQRSDASGNISRYPINLSALSGGSEVLPMQTLQGGDSLIVPRAEHFSIQGEVTTPGRYRLEPGMTVLQALARAGGITLRGSQHRIELQRLTKDKKLTIVHAKLGDAVQAEDILKVKESIF